MSFINKYFVPYFNLYLKKKSVTSMKIKGLRFYVKSGYFKLKYIPRIQKKNPNWHVVYYAIYKNAF